MILPEPLLKACPNEILIDPPTSPSARSMAVDEQIPRSDASLETVLSLLGCAVLGQLRQCALAEAEIRELNAVIALHFTLRYIRPEVDADQGQRGDSTSLDIDVWWDDERARWCGLAQLSS